MHAHPLNAAHRNTAVHPGDDFYEYAVGKWVGETPLPAEYSRWGSFEELQEENLAQLKDICEHPEQFAGTPLESIANKVHALYTVGMNEDRVTREGTLPLLPELQKIEQLQTVDDVVANIARLHRTCASPLFHFGPTTDAKDSTMMIAGLYQGGLGLPDRDYYLSNEERFSYIRQEYKFHVIKMHKLLGVDEQVGDSEAEKIIALETKLAQASTVREELRDPHKNYHKMSRSELTKLSPGFAWDTFFAGMEVATDTLDVGQLEFFECVSELVQTVPVAEWKMYLRWHLIQSLGGFLGKNFEEELFRFNGQILSGQKKMKPRWKRVLKHIGVLMDMALGQLYVHTHFPDSAKERADALVKQLVSTFGERIDRLRWMSEVTKQAAHTKLGAIRPKIGYPTKWREYSGLDIDPNASYAENAIAAFTFNTRHELNKIDKPVDREEWFVSPHVINAFYDPQKNEIVFPAAILQPPFFYADADDAVNYGAIGGIIGHELTHGFDDEGRKFDEKGNMRDWWNADDETKFKAHADKLVEQFNAYTPLENIYVNGRFTLGENIADLGGVAIAFDALQKVLGDKREKIDELTPEQRFFLSWAEGWRHVIAPELARLYLTIDPHAPGKFRVNGPLSNTDAFYEAFDVKKDNSMFRPEDERVRIW